MAERVIGSGGRGKKLRQHKPVLAWRDSSRRTKIKPKKVLITCGVALAGWLVVLLCIDVWEHDQTLVEALKGAPHQMLDIMGSLWAMGWQFKLGALVVICVVATIFYIRQVSEVPPGN